MIAVADAVEEIELEAFETVEKQINAPDPLSASGIELNRNVLFSIAGYLEDKFLEPERDFNERMLERLDLAGHS